MTTRLPRLQLTWRATAILLALLALPLAIIVAANSLPPVIDQRIGDTTLRFSADRAWALLPGDCVSIRWEVEGIESLYVEGRGEIGYGEKAFCPAIKDKAARFALRTPDGLYREYDLRIKYLPDLILYLAGFVGAVGSPGLIAYLLIANRMDSALNPRWGAICLAALVVIGAALRLNEPEPPRLEAEDGQVKVAVWAEHASRVFPMECVRVHISTAGADSLRFNGEAVSLAEGIATAKHCDRQGDMAWLEVAGTDGETRAFALPIPSLPGGVSNGRGFYQASVLALFACALVYLPMTYMGGRSLWRRREWADLLAVGCYAVALLILYLPFGFDSPPNWEEWVARARLEGGFRVMHTELPFRFLSLLPHTVAWHIGSESFAGLHLAQFAALWLQPALLYGCLRKLGTRSLYAFLIGALYMAFPVFDLRFLLATVLQNTSIAFLLAGLLCALDYLRHPSRLALAGAGLALLVNASMYEAGIALLAALPFLLWIRRGKSCWRRVNLALLFVCASAFKVGYMALLYATDRPFYNERLLDSQRGQGAALLQNPLETAFAVLPRVYERSFVTGWSEAVATLSDSQWLGYCLLATVCVVCVAWLLRGSGDAPAARSIAWALLGSMLAILPAVGALMWLPQFTQGTMPRLYFYVPPAAAIAVFCVLLLLTRGIRGSRWRDGTLIGLCLPLLLSGLSWSFAQHARWTERAESKARVLHAMLALVPKPDADATLMAVTTMSYDEMVARRIDEMRHFRMFSSAIRVVYGDNAPYDALFCFTRDYCSLSLRGQHERHDAQRLAKTIVVELKHDLTVALVDDPAAYLGRELESDYDAESLFDANAPLPPRAATMLGAGDSSSN